MKKIGLISISLLLLAVLSIFGLSTVTNAQSFHAEEKMSVAKDEVISSMLMAVGKDVDMAGTVEGDMYCAGQNITISGLVEGDIICAGQNITVTGAVNGDIRLFGQNISISGAINGSATLGAQNVSIEKPGTISNDIAGGAGSININGTVGRDMAIGAETVYLSGSVGRDIKGSIGSLSINSNAKVNGSIDITSGNDPIVHDSKSVAGKITVYEPKVENSTSKPLFANYFGNVIFSAVWSIIIGLVLMLVMPKVLNNAVAKFNKQPGKVFTTGILSALLMPTSIILLVLTIVGIPIAIITGIIWILIMILSAPFCGYAIGNFALTKIAKQPIWQMIAGVTLLAIITNLPVIGFFAGLASYSIGSGMILLELVKVTSRK